MTSRNPIGDDTITRSVLSRLISRHGTNRYTALSLLDAPMAKNVTVPHWKGRACIAILSDGKLNDYALYTGVAVSAFPRAQTSPWTTAHARN